MKSDHSTPIKVLHIGNVANYAYNIAKVLQTDRIKSDVVTWDYYHINARPIWEEGEFDATLAGDHFFPRLPSAAEARYKEPDWYWHGPRRLVTLGLIAQNEGKFKLAGLLRRMADRYMRKVANPQFRARDTGQGLTRAFEVLAADLAGGMGSPQSPAQLERWLSARAWGRPFRPLANRLAQRASQRTPAPVDTGDAEFDARATRLLEQYRAEWPERDIDPMLVNQFKTDQTLLKRLFKPYDVIIGYSTDGIWPLMAGHRFLAYEFGTIRNLPFEDSVMGKIAAVVYRNSDLTIVTNCDNEAPAKRLARPYRFLPHVINEGGRVEHDHALRKRLVARHGGSFYIFHPPRQHWDETRNTNWDKGNDKLIRAFARLVKDHGADARLVAVKWGVSLKESQALIAELGLQDHVIWLDPQPHRVMMRTIAACDVVADQFTIPTFGGIPPKAFYAGRPVITSFDPELHRWCFDELPPLLPANSPEMIEAALVRLWREPAYARDVAARAAAWYERENSNARIRQILTEMVDDEITARNAAATR